MGTMISIARVVGSWFSRRDDRADFRAVILSYQRFSEDLKNDMESLKEEVRSLKAENQELRRQHAECHQSQLELRKRITELELEVKNA